MGRHLIPEIADALKAQDLLEKDAQFTTVDQMLDGLRHLITTGGVGEHAAARCAKPPERMDRDSSRGSTDEALEPPVARHDRPVGQSSRQSRRGRTDLCRNSSMLALGAVRAGTLRTGQIFGGAARSLQADADRDTTGRLRTVCRETASTLHPRCGEPVLARSDDAHSTHAREGAAQKR
jgi:hypothetical protein